MRAADWQQWLGSLPGDAVGLQQIEAELHRQIVLAEARFRAAVWQGNNRVEERAARVQVIELNSKLMATRTRSSVA